MGTFPKFETLEKFSFGEGTRPKRKKTSPKIQEGSSN